MVVIHAGDSTTRFLSQLYEHRGGIDQYELQEAPMRMKELGDVKSALTTFNYDNLFYFKWET